MFSERIQTVIDRVDRLRDQVDDHWQIPADEARVLAQLISIGGCVSICEIGIHRRLPQAPSSRGAKKPRGPGRKLKPRGHHSELDLSAR
jgi:hypothetical protein